MKEEVRERATTRSRLRRPQVLRDPTEEPRASTWLELFFDLCFVVAVASATAGTDWAPPAVLTGVFDFVTAACVWWLYFDYAGSSALTLRVRSGFSWGYAHFFIYASTAAFGVGTQLAIEGAAAHPEIAAAAGVPGEEFGAGARAIQAGAVAV